MASNPQIACESPANPLQVSKPLKGKYDKRYKIKAEPVDGGSRINAGRKPTWAKHLSKNTAANVLDQVDLKAKLIELINTENERLRFDVLCYVWDRLEGKPFTAENPNVSKQVSVLNQDNRLQIAIQQLLPSKGEGKAKRKPQAKLLEENVVSTPQREPQPEPGVGE